MLLSILIIALIMAVAVIAVYTLIKYRKLSVLLKFFSVFLLVSSALADDPPFAPPEDGPGLVIVAVDDKPIVDPANLPIAAQSLATAIDGFGEELAVMAGHEAFLRDNWTMNASNMTGLFYA